LSERSSPFLFRTPQFPQLLSLSYFFLKPGSMLNTKAELILRFLAREMIRLLLYYISTASVVNPGAPGCNNTN